MLNRICILLMTVAVFSSPSLVGAVDQEKIRVLERDALGREIPNDIIGVEADLDCEGDDALLCRALSALSREAAEKETGINLRDARNGCATRSDEFCAALVPWIDQTENTLRYEKWRRHAVPAPEGPGGPGGCIECTDCWDWQCCCSSGNCDCLVAFYCPGHAVETYCLNCGDGWKPCGLMQWHPELPCQIWCADCEGCLGSGGSPGGRSTEACN